MFEIHYQWTQPERISQGSKLCLQPSLVSTQMCATGEVNATPSPDPSVLSTGGRRGMISKHNPSRKDVELQS